MNMTMNQGNSNPGSNRTPRRVSRRRVLKGAAAAAVA